MNKRRWITLLSILALVGAAATLPAAANALQRFQQQPPAPKISLVEEMLAEVAGMGAKIKGSCTALVAADGTLDRGKNTKSSANLGTGRYEVICKKKQRKCIATCSTGLTGFTFVPPPGICTLTGRAGNLKGWFMATYDPDGTPADHPFYLESHC